MCQTLELYIKQGKHFFLLISEVLANSVISLALTVVLSVLCVFSVETGCTVTQGHLHTGTASQSSAHRQKRHRCPAGKLDNGNRN